LYAKPKKLHPKPKIDDTNGKEKELKKYFELWRPDG